MALDPVTNFAKVTVSTTYDAVATSIVLGSGEGAKLPQPSTDGDFNISWYDATNYPDPSDDPNVEIVRVTARSTDTLTVTRNQESSGASTKSTGGASYKMYLSPTKKMMDDIDTIMSLLNPVGTIREFNVSTNPATLLGFGTWSAHGTGRVSVAIDAGDTDFDIVDETGGEKTHQLTVAELASHNHPVTDFWTAGAAGSINYSLPSPFKDKAARNTENTGSNTPHNNVQPYVVVYRWVRTA